MKVARFAPWRCWKCGYLMDAASDAFGNALPAEMDLAICLRCAAVYVLHDHHWKPITDDELIDMTVDQKRKMSRVQWAVGKLRKKQESNNGSKN